MAKSCIPDRPTELPAGQLVNLDGSTIIRGDQREIQFNWQNTGTDGTLVNSGLIFTMQRSGSGQTPFFTLDRSIVGDFTVLTETDTEITGTFIIPPEATTVLPNRDLTVLWFFQVIPDGGGPFTRNGTLNVLAGPG